MLLHNQKKAPISWEADGDVFTWDGYGSCDVPEKYLAHIKAQGFPVEIGRAHV